MAILGCALVARGITGRSPLYKAFGISTVGDEPADVECAITINVEPARLYTFWRDFENLPQVMPRLKEVTVLDNGRSRWVAKGPVGTAVEWEAELVEDHAPELIAWRALPGRAQVWSAGEVRFRPAPGDRGTEVHVRIRYDPPAGRVGQLVAKLAGEEPSSQVADSLRRLKMIFEAGEVATSAMRPDQDAEQGKQPWHGQAGLTERAREVGQ
ncbi:MAG: cyclase [Chloroflexales bacterium]|nr:cyclase [Chloroflexales bacterium]